MTWRAPASAVAPPSPTLLTVTERAGREDRQGAESRQAGRVEEIGRDDIADLRIAYMIDIDHDTHRHTDTHTVKGNAHHAQYTPTHPDTRHQSPRRDTYYTS